MRTATTTGDGGTRRRLVPAWVGLGLYAGYSLARGVAGFGGGSGLGSLPDAPNRPGLAAGIAGGAGSVGSTASSGPGGALLCPPRRQGTLEPREYEPDLEDELIRRSLRKSVPDFDEDVDEQPDDAPSGGPGPSTHGFGEEAAEGPATEDRPATPRPDPRPDHLSAIELIRTRPCAAMALLGLAVSLVALGFELAYLRRLANTTARSPTALLDPTGRDIVRNAAFGAWGVAWMMLVTFSLRTFRLRDMVRFWLVGFFAATGIVAVVGAGITAAMAPGLLRSAVVIPIFEELVKALLVAAFLVVAVRGRGREPAVTDLVIVGFAVGAAFGVHEDALWVRVLADGFGAGWGLAFPVFVWDPVVIVGHAGWTALTGLGLGLAWHFRRHKPAWILAVVPFAVATFDHVAINYVVFQAAEHQVTRGAGWTMRELTNHGTLVAQILLAGFVVAIVVDWLALRRRLASDPLPPRSTLPGMWERIRALPGARATLLGGILLLGERRARLGARYARDRTQRRPGDALAGT